MGINNIEKKNFSYSLLKLYTKWWHNKIFYKKVILINSHLVPSADHLMFTPNHQNALMDALGPLYNIDRQLVFLARADIFSKVWMARILYFLKILPIFRIRDGYESLKKNDAIFQKTIDVINAGNGLVILPEGNHEGLLRLRELKKGFARIAFRTEEENNFTMNIQIVPMGLYYTDYEKFRSTLIIHFGNPIPVSDFYHLYKENKAIAITQLKDQLSDAIKALIIHIESEENYELFKEICKFRDAQLFAEKPPKLKLEERQFFAKKELITWLENDNKKKPEQFSLLKDDMDQFSSLIKKSGFDYQTFEKGLPSFITLFFHSLTLLIGFPIFIYGYLNNFLPWQITLSLAGKIKDRQFLSSVKFVLSAFLFPIFYILQILILSMIFPNQILTIAYLISLPLSAILSLNYFISFEILRKKWHLALLKRNNPLLFRNIIELHRKITYSISRVLNKSEINL